MMANTFIQDDSFVECLNEQITQVTITNDNRILRDRFVFSRVTVTEISNFIARFKSSFPVYDEISMNIFKDNMHPLGEIITYICNKSFQESVLKKG